MEKGRNCSPGDKRLFEITEVEITRVDCSIVKTGTPKVIAINVFEMEKSKVLSQKATFSCGIANSVDQIRLLLRSLILDYTVCSDQSVVVPRIIKVLVIL